MSGLWRNNRKKIGSAGVTVRMHLWEGLDYVPRAFSI